MKTYLFPIILCAILVGCSQHRENMCQLPTQDISQMYEDYVEQWKSEAKESFIQAESKVFVVAPKPPKPDDGTNPDASKCICKGTGIIVQGDGHKTACPYHGSQFQGMNPKSKDVIIKEFRR